jgi:RimJ/RimL family protein N-acetyltransferase
MSDMPLEWSPARRPDRVPLQGARVRLEPIDPRRHQIGLFVAAGEPEIWRYLPYGPYDDEAALAAQLEANAASEDPLFYAIVDLRDGRAGGMASYLRITPEHGVIEIGHIWLGLSLQRTREATEAIYLLARHAFDDLGYRRFEWKCNAANAASRRAAERFGFTFEGIFRQHQIVKGRNRDTAWYAMLDHEWPATRAAFEAWLGDDNFDEDGRQRQRLEELRAIALGRSGGTRAS